MTREELVQMREYKVAQASTEYWNKNKDNNDDVSIMTAFEDGAAWADEHPKNPCISVDERLPEESKKYKGWLSDTVFVITNKNDGTSARYDHATKTWCPAKILQGSITHWMPMPEIEINIV